jgi:ABC-type multidrug transport system fused ATPase/permease subunit
MRLDAVLTLAAVAVAPFFWLLITGFGKQIDRRAKAYHENESGLVSRLQESLSSIRVVQAFSREPETNALVDAQAERSLTSLKSQVFVQLAFSACVGLAMSLGTALVIWLGAERVLTGRLSIGDILVFLAYLAMLYQPMNAISQSSSIIHSAKAQLRRVFEVLDEEPEVKDKIDAISLPMVRGDIEFDRVSFAYADEPVLANIDLKIGAGQTVAIVGATGTGKTTLASLLLRFYDPNEGSVRLDGHDLRDLRIEWLRGQVAVVLQDAILFGATIEENIAYARPDASAADITGAAKRAQADEFILALPDGYQTVLGERGVNLSGGQRQRLAIARAFLKDAPILVLDEPTSALDALTENVLVESVRQLSKGRTTILISHRLSTVRLADKIVVLDNGGLVEEGTHSELISRPSHYRELYDAQRGMSLSKPVS